jgi:hypothetical protein
MLTRVFPVWMPRNWLMFITIKSRLSRPRAGWAIYLTPGTVRISRRWGSRTWPDEFAADEFLEER